MDLPEVNVTRFLHAWHEGDQEAINDLFPLIYEELRRRARGYMRRERPDHTLQATALVNEIWLKLIKAPPDIDWQNRDQFFAIVATEFRRFLIQHARKNIAEMRGGRHEKALLEDALLVSVPQKDVDLINLDEALSELEKLDALQGKIVELRYFVGFTIEETAEALNMSPATVKREWKAAKTWLLFKLKKT
jgi:RNA polymerase sigma factor (TIGR02999 family)